MNWFDATGLASIAKTALKEAQKTIDKALDIKEEDSTTVPSNTPVDTNPDDFFGTWGVANAGSAVKDVKKTTEEAMKQSKMTPSIWGSFTGSFFEVADAPKTTKSSSIDSLDDSMDFSQSKLVVQNSDEVDNQHSKLLVNEIGEGDVENADNKEYEENMTEINLDSAEPFLQKSLLTVKRREKPSSSHLNRLSAISTESGKNSSESLDIITPSTECTTSPESDVLSVTNSLSTSSSAPGSKPISDSIEIVQESLTSPSSVEVLGTNSSSRRESQQNTDDFVSPLESPWDKSSSSIEKISPESVEVIPEDVDENSVAEDTMSYTSISESTSATVLDSAFNLHIKPQKMLKDAYSRPDLISDSSPPEPAQSPETNFNVTDAITRAPSRSTMHLPLASVNQVLIDTQPQSTNQDLPDMLKKSNIIDIPQDNDSITSSTIDNQMDTSTDEGSQSDKTIMANDNIMESSSDTSTTETSSHSSYLKTMLADAMTEKGSDKSGQFIDLSQGMLCSTTNEEMLESISLNQLDMPPRENSPISSESRSDLVKIGSDYTSGHTSGDELETTTSSDIEIISSPNGDSSSTQSRQSPAKQTCIKSKNEGSTVDSLLSRMTMKKAKGHNRELSEASSISDDSHSSELDRLIKRISEMTEILESRESKLIEVTRRNAELQEQNKDLKHQLDMMLTKQLESADVSQVTEEYTQRLSALEKKFQQAIREKDTLRKQLEHSRQDAAARLSKGELESLISEKDETIKELREEGEKLSKQQLQHSNIIKKLRAKEKENESTIKHMKETIESLSSESDRLKKSLTAKEDVERSQIEAIHQLTAKNKKIEGDIVKLQSQFDDLKEKYDTAKKSLDAAKKELQDKNRTSLDLLAREQMLESLENEKRMTESQNEEIMGQLENLRMKLRQSDQNYLKKEQTLKNENNELLQRLEETEARNEELSQSILEVSKPLVRQLESLQATHNIKAASYEKMEQEYSFKISELQSRLQAGSNIERSAKEESIALRSNVTDLEGQLNSTNHQLEILQMKLDQQNAEKQISEHNLKMEIGSLKDLLTMEKQKVDEQLRELESLKQQLRIAKDSKELEMKHSQDPISDPPTIVDARLSPQAGSNSPTLSLGKASVADSLSSSFWSQDEPIDITQTPRYTNMFEIQMLQSNLKQKDGELQQLQWELNRREQERSLLNSEISSLLTKVEGLEASVEELNTLKVQFEEVQQQYDTLCQLYGEKVEENEELKLDLQDVKEMYKGQIDELLRQQRQHT